MEHALYKKEEGHQDLLPGFDGDQYICSPKGVTLQDLIKKDVVNIKKLSEFFKKIRSVSEADNLFHRDLKPANIIWQDDKFYLIDFGLSLELSDSNINTTDLTVGTRQYMPKPFDKDYLPPEDTKFDSAKAHLVKLQEYAIAKIMKEASGESPS